MNSCFNINHYVNDGFVKVADVINTSNLTWKLVNRNVDYLWSDHNSWVYMIVTGEEIVKVGETGNPLGIRTQVGDTTQPSVNTRNRFGRLRGVGTARANSTDTDCRIRWQLQEDASRGLVSLWAKKCSQQTVNEPIGGVVRSVKLSSHKCLELEYLNYMQHCSGDLPRLNRALK
tara:strand:- start:1076 stop:1597 length:522 start_codon:yes stop_codon:yes gene_type:complete